MRPFSSIVSAGIFVVLPYDPAVTPVVVSDSDRSLLSAPPPVSPSMVLTARVLGTLAARSVVSPLILDCAMAAAASTSAFTISVAGDWRTPATDFHSPVPPTSGRLLWRCDGCPSPNCIVAVCPLADAFTSIST
jgi:hypothetical protein